MSQYTHGFQDTISCIQQKASALTRRSAGLPAMITGILTSYPTGTFFDSVILDLQAIAEAPVQNTVRFEDLRLPQVHALNCLKDVFTNTQLGSGTELHVADTLDIAAGCLETDTYESLQTQSKSSAERQADGRFEIAVLCSSKHC